MASRRQQWAPGKMPVALVFTSQRGIEDARAGQSGDFMIMTRRRTRFAFPGHVLTYGFRYTHSFSKKRDNQRWFLTPKNY